MGNGGSRGRARSTKSATSSATGGATGASTRKKVDNSPAAYQRRQWADAVPGLRARAQRIAAQPVPTLKPAQSQITLRAQSRADLEQARETSRAALVTEMRSLPGGRQLSGPLSTRQRNELKEFDKQTRAMVRHYDETAREVAKAQAGPTKAAADRIARLNSPEGTAVRKTIRDTTMNLEVARAQRRSEAPGTAAYQKALTHEQTLGATLKAANEQYRLIESGKVKVGATGKTSSSKSAKTSAATRTSTPSLAPGNPIPLHAIVAHYAPGERQAAIGKFSADTLRKTVAQLQEQHPGTKPAGASKQARVDYIMSHLPSEQSA